jgi:hypothetical protein
MITSRRVREGKHVAHKKEEKYIETFSGKVRRKETNRKA